MSEPLNYQMTQDSITVIVDGKAHPVQKGAANFQALRDAIYNEKWDEALKHLTTKKSISTWSQGNFTINDNGTVLYKGSTEELPAGFGKRIIKMATNGEDPTPLFKFWERLQKNPSYRSVQQLWGFLDHHGIPFTSEGRFLAYKGVNQNYTDAHTGTISNKPGVTNEMPRNKISDDPKVACHEGFHVGAKGHAQGYGSRMIICEVDPEDVVCVPYDASQQKMRVCKYTVLGNYGEDLPSTVLDTSDSLPVRPAPEDEPELDDKDEEFIEEAKEAEKVAASATEDEEECAPDYDPEMDPLRDDAEGIEPEEPKKEDAVERKPAKGFAKFDKLDTEGLLKLSLDDLRAYAGKGLSIVGASKIPGGKVALIAKIMEARK